MEDFFRRSYPIRATEVDCFDRLKLSRILDLLQDVAGGHCTLLGTDRERLARQGLFWAVIRHRVQIIRLPQAYETLHLETWPMPTTRTAFPRATCVYDGEGREALRCVSLWVLMDMERRSLVLPGESGVAVSGTLRGGELRVPGSIALKNLSCHTQRSVRFSDLDWNGHMNNCRYMDWVQDVLPASYHRSHRPLEFAVNYAQEATEGTEISLNWGMDPAGCLVLEGRSGDSRIFSAKVQYGDSGVL